MKFVQDTLRYIIIGAVFCLPFVPFIVSNTLFFPFITGKNFAFRIIVEIMAAAWLALALCLPQYRPRRSWVLAAYAAFVLIIGVADTFGAYPFKSVWSNFERMEGWVTLAHLLAYLVVVASVVNTEKLWHRLFHVSIVASIVMSCFGFMQTLGWVSVAAGFSSAQRIDATFFGNPIYLAAYMLFHVFLAAMLWVQMQKSRPAREHLWPAIFYCTAIIFDTLALLLSGTRGAMLGLIGGAFLAVLLMAFGSETRRWRWIAGGFLVGLIVLGGALVAARDSSFVRQVGFLNRLSSISLTEATAKARLLNMGMAWQGVKERPILGWGQENYAIVFDKYYDPRMYGQEQWFDRVHNSVFDWWIAGGTLGLLAFLSVFLAALWVLWRPLFRKKAKAAFTHEERSILTGLLAGYFFHNLTVFDNVTSSILFATVLGYIVYRESAANDAAPLTQVTIIPKGGLSFVAALCAVFAAFSIWSINGSAIAANKALIAGMQGQAGGLAQNLALFDKAISYNTMGTQETREQLAQITLQILASDQVPAEMKTQFVQKAVSELDKQSAASSLDARFPLFAAGVLDAAGRYKEAAVYYQKAHDLSPRKQTILYQMGQNAFLRGESALGITYFAQAYELEKSNFTAATYLARAYYTVGDRKNAIATLEEAARISPDNKGQADELTKEIKGGALKP